MDSYLAIIPARYGSTRFPGKPLADIHGKPMIQRVYERVASLLSDVLVATDDERILKIIRRFGGNAIMTSENHQSGTDRCAEALEHWENLQNKTFRVVVNVQGDEPFIHTDQIELLMKCFTDPDVQIATLIKPIEDPSVATDINRPKVVIGKNGDALYFSRSPVPYIRNIPVEKWPGGHIMYQHIGLYAYRADILKEIASLEPSTLEKSESLEQLRWIENGYKIRTAITPFESYSVDTPADLEKVLKSGLL
jgi:3-deoxy-manno-octulosonate cytidylyltransferase (CMP-KDO synthetase)